MRKYIIIISLLLISSFIGKAQNEPNNEGEIKTLFGNIEDHGIYGAFSLRYNSVDSRDGILIGGRGGWIINHSLVIGGGGYGFFNEQRESKTLSKYLDPNNKYNLAGGYGGVLMEFIISPKSPIHISVPVLIGAGSVDFAKNIFDDNNFNSNDSDKSGDLDNSSFFVLEPGIEIEMNLFQFLRVSLGAYYRYTSNITLEETFTNTEDNTSEKIVLADKDVLRGFSFGINFKFGKF